MDDLISRQNAIKDAESWVAADDYEKHLQKNVVEWLKEFPSAEHDTNLAEVGTDLISRQQAIEVVQNRHMMLSKEKVLLINDLEKLPSAELEVEEEDVVHIIFETLSECGIYGEEATIKLIGTLKRLRKYNLLPPCMR